MGGIGSHLKVSQVDQSVCLGNELNNLSAIKRFFQIIAPYQVGKQFFVNFRTLSKSCVKVRKDYDTLKQDGKDFPILMTSR